MDVCDLLLVADRNGVQMAAESGGVHYANFNVTEKWQWISNYKPFDHNTFALEVEKLYAVADTPQVIDLIQEHLPSGTHLHVSRDGLAMIMHVEATKSNATAALAAHWGIRRSEIAAFGDDANDIDLLRYCGVGVAVANAIEDAKTVADDICDCNDSDGVAKWLEENVLFG